jgi:hypothetical protein
MLSDNNQLTYAALGAEIQQCGQVLKDYSAKVNEGLEHMLEIHRHIVLLQQEQVNLLSQVPPSPGAPQ